MLEKLKTVKEWQDALRNHVLNVHFTKADGTERAMICTLNQQEIPAELMPSKPAKESQELVRVFDLEMEGWRSFRIASVTNVFICE
jgi:hypothetical protein